MNVKGEEILGITVICNIIKIIKNIIFNIIKIKNIILISELETLIRFIIDFFKYIYCYDFM